MEVHPLLGLPDLAAERADIVFTHPSFPHISSRCLPFIILTTKHRRGNKNLYTTIPSAII
jgi:hypothetical protein